VGLNEQIMSFSSTCLLVGAWGSIISWVIYATNNIPQHQEDPALVLLM
jgi:hypothetical protein